jgi:hypothetical protein
VRLPRIKPIVVEKVRRRSVGPTDRAEPKPDDPPPSPCAPALAQRVPDDEPDEEGRSG